MSTREITDVSELKAVSHPLRVRLLGALRDSGPATATELARRFDTETGSTSYHLRVLAKYGFVEDEPGAAGHHRQRRWRAVHQLTSWNNAALATSPDGRAAIAVMHSHQLRVLAASVADFDGRIDRLDPEWIESSGMSDWVVRLTPAAMAELFDRLSGHLAELTARSADDPAAIQVTLFAAGFPRREEE